MKHLLAKFACQRRTGPIFFLFLTLLIYQLISLLSLQLQTRGNLDILKSEITAPVNNLRTARARYSYVFLVGGCDPDEPLYRNFLYNILVSVKILREHGSKADVTVFLQLKSTTNATQLPNRDIEPLKAYNIRTFYIPPSNKASFYSLMFEKFRILSLTEYDRVLYMDADIMPLANLDYLFHLSAEREGVLEENVVMAGLLEPANGGFFMLKPNRSHMEELTDIVRQRHENARTMEFPYFDEYYGWGHVITPPDKWATMKQGVEGTNWTFCAAFADQGLLYYWTKYVRKRVSIIRWNKVQNYRPVGSNGTVVLAETLDSPFRNYSHRIPVKEGRKDFNHFTGGAKPWFCPLPIDLSIETKYDSYLHFWYWNFQQVNDKFNLIQNLTVNRSIAGDYKKVGGKGAGKFPLKHSVLVGTTGFDTHYEAF